MRRVFVVFIIVVVLAGAGYLFLAQRAKATEAATADAADLQPAVAVGNVVVAEARVLPERSARLSAVVGGVVAEVAVAEGDRVESGQVLVSLESGHQRAAVAQAEAQLQSAQARLAQVKAGASTPERRSVQAGLDAARARLAQLRAGARTAEVAAAKAGLAEARAGLQKTLQGAKPEQLIDAESGLADAEANVRQAQAAYDRVQGQPDVAAMPQASALQRATNAYETAEAHLQLLLRGADKDDVAAARARVARAQAQVDLLAGTDEHQIAVAEAEVRRAQAELDRVASYARPEAVALAEADVATADAALGAARLALAETEIRAPFAGVATSLTVVVGEQISQGATLLRIADLSLWQIETKDLTEINVVKVVVGAPVTFTVDALPGRTFSGTVKAIEAYGEDKMGDIVYRVVMVPAGPEPDLRWNMTVATRIEAGD